MKMIAASDLDTTTKMVACAIGLHAGANTGMAWPGFPKIAKDASCDLTTAKRKVKLLAESGWLHKSSNAGGRGKSNIYRLTEPVDKPLVNGGTGPPFGSETVAQDHPNGGTRPPFPSAKRWHRTTRTEVIEQGRPSTASNGERPQGTTQTLADFPIEESLADYWRRVNGKTRR